MSWVQEPKRTWAEWAAIKVLRVGPIPQHVAFIMDGNRRFARQLHKDTLDGHSEGFRKLTEVLSWCRDLSISQVTVYAFSIENFKRAKAEVDGLMQLAEEKMEQLLQETERLRKYGVRIRVIGRIELLTEKLRRLLAQSVMATMDNDQCCLTLALAYTAREEMTTAVQVLRQGVLEGRLEESDISEKLVGECLYTMGMKDPELLIRTSGEVRLSDFLLWQTGLSYLFFTKVLWPQLSLWHLLAAVFHYQRHHHTLLQLRREEATRRQRKEEDAWVADGQDMSVEQFLQEKMERKEKFLLHLRENRLKTLKEFAGLS